MTKRFGGTHIDASTCLTRAWVIVARDEAFSSRRISIAVLHNCESESVIHSIRFGARMMRSK